MPDYRVKKSEMTPEQLRELEERREELRQLKLEATRQFKEWKRKAMPRVGSQIQYEHEMCSVHAKFPKQEYIYIRVPGDTFLTGVWIGELLDMPEICYEHIEMLMPWQEGNRYGK